MSLYNTLFGVNPCAGTLLKMLGADPLGVPRFRDCFLKGNAIVIYTRTGGANREDYQYPIAWLRSLPGFLVDHDDALDSTYAYFAYRIPDEYIETCNVLRNMGAERDPAVAMRELLAKLKDPACKEDPEVQEAVKKMSPIFDKLNASFEGNGPKIIEI